MMKAHITSITFDKVDLGSATQESLTVRVTEQIILEIISKNMKDKKIAGSGMKLTKGIWLIRRMWETQNLLLNKKHLGRIISTCVSNWWGCGRLEPDCSPVVFREWRNNRYKRKYRKFPLTLKKKQPNYFMVRVIKDSKRLYMCLEMLKTQLESHPGNLL